MAGKQIKIIGKKNRNGCEEFCIYFGKLKQADGFGSMFEYKNEITESKISYKSELLRYETEYKAVYSAVMAAENYIRKFPAGSKDIAVLAWNQYLEKKQLKLFGQEQL